MLYTDDQPLTPTDPVAPAQRSNAAKAKDAIKLAIDELKLAAETANAKK